MEAGYSGEVPFSPSGFSPGLMTSNPHVITSDINLQHLVSIVSARCFHWKVTPFSFLSEVSHVSSPLSRWGEGLSPREELSMHIIMHLSDKSTPQNSLPVWSQWCLVCEPLFFHIFSNSIRGLLRWLSGKESTCQCSSIPRSARASGGGNGNLLQYSCLGNPMDRGAWWAIVHRAAKSDMAEWLSTHECNNIRNPYTQKCDYNENCNQCVLLENCILFE